MTTKKNTPQSEPITTLAVATAATRELTPGIWAMIEKMAPSMFKSRLFGVQSIEQAQAIMLKGYELGLSMTASFELVQVIQGKPALSPRGAMAILLSSVVMKSIDIKRLTDAKGFIGYECTMTRTTGFSFTGRFTLEHAKAAGLVKADSGWAKYPENMCLWRAVGFAADVVFPDVTAGMTTLMKAPEMYGVALTEGGDVIDATAVNVPEIKPVDKLIAEYTPERVAQTAIATINKFPDTDEDIEKVRQALITQDAMVAAGNRD